MPKKEDLKTCPNCEVKEKCWEILFEAVGECFSEGAHSADIATVLSLFTVEFVYSEAPDNEVATGILLASISRKMDDLIEEGQTTEAEIVSDLEDLEESIKKGKDDEKTVH